MEADQSNYEEQLLEEILDQAIPDSETSMTASDSVANICSHKEEVNLTKPDLDDSIEEILVNPIQGSLTDADLDILMSQLNQVKDDPKAREHYRMVLHRFSIAQLATSVLSCPATKCQKKFLCTRLFRHIAFEHKRVPSYIIHLYQETVVDINVGVISLGETVVVAQLAIPRQLADEATSLDHNIDSAFTFQVFAAKQPLNSKGPEQSSLLNFWVSGFVDELFSYTLEVYADDRSVTYGSHGYVNSLKNSNTVFDIFQNAQCLMMHSANVNRLTQNENFSMSLKIIIGCRDIEGY